MQLFLVLDLFQELGDGGASLGQVPVFVPMTRARRRSLICDVDL